MERTKNTDEPKEKKIKWRKEGGGSFVMRNRMIKPGQVFDAYPSEIPISFRDTIIPLEKLPPPPEEVVVPVVDAKEYTLASRGGGWFNIVDSDGKVQNEKALKREDALKLIDELVK